MTDDGQTFNIDPAVARLEAAQDRLAAARDAGDRQAMLSAHDAVERAAAEVAGQR